MNKAQWRYIVFFLFHLLVTVILLYAIAGKSAEWKGELVTSLFVSN